MIFLYIYLSITLVLFSIVVINTSNDKDCYNLNLKQLPVLLTMCVIQTIPFLFAIIWDSGELLLDYLGGILKSQNGK